MNAQNVFWVAGLLLIMSALPFNGGPGERDLYFALGGMGIASIIVAFAISFLNRTKYPTAY